MKNPTAPFKPQSSKRTKRLIKTKQSISEDLSKVRIKVHLIEFTGWYTWNDLKYYLGALKIMKDDPDEMPNYGVYSIRQMKKRKLHIFTSPKEGGYPQCVIRTSNPSIKFLYNLSRKLDCLNVSKCEYTIDLFFPNSKIKKYFMLLRRYIYFPYQKRLETFSESKSISSQNRKTNATLIAGQPRYSKKGKEKKMEIFLRMYERGPDKKKIKNAKSQYWNIDDLDRIRIEYIAKREILKKNFVRRLSDFLEGPNFASVLKRRFLFRRFKKSPKFVQEYHQYRTEDKQGHTGSFHSEFLSSKKYSKNTSQYMDELKELNHFHKKIETAINLKDEEWKLKIKEIYSKSF